MFPDNLLLIIQLMAMKEMVKDKGKVRVKERQHGIWS
jgi:hypothetical protein